MIPCPEDDPHSGSGTALRDAGGAQDRIAGLLRDHFRSVWRCVRRLGVGMDAADDATQQVFVTASTKLDRIEPGKERAFLMGTAARIAANHRRAQRRNRETPCADMADRARSASPSAEDLLDAKRMLALLDRALDTLTDDIRTVFVLCRLEGLSRVEAAELLQLPPGTVASRYRRANVEFGKAVERLHREWGQSK